MLSKRYPGKLTQTFRWHGTCKNYGCYETLQLIDCLKGEIVSAGKTVLIIDDEELITSSLSYYLSGNGYDVTAVNFSETVLSIIDLERFDIVLSDIRMTPVSGVEIAGHLRRSAFGGKIIMMSACFKEFEKELRELKVDAMLQKPFELSSLLEVMRA